MIHLHVHSSFSFLDGASSPDQLVQRAAEMGMKALALTDHHGLYGIVRFMKAARAHGIKPIIGAEICLSGESPADRHHLVLLAKNRQGYANLCRIITKAQLDHQDDPHLTFADLVPYREGLIALSGCRRGEIAAYLLQDRRDRALAAAARYAEVFDGDFWIELEHHLLPDDTSLVDALHDVAQETGLGCVIANDVHYATPDGYRLRDVMACIQSRTTLEEWSDGRHPNGEYYLKSEEELRAAFDLPDDRFSACITATEQIADACELELLAVTCRPPDFPVPNNETPFSFLYKLCQEGARERYWPLTPEVSNQLAHELSVIEEMGLASFFLCVWDIVRFARNHGIRCAGRGSAADSIVAFALGITTVDPIANNLLFERFLNPGRVGMPDVDIDFDSRRRDEVIDYIQDRYTTAHAAMVANVITYRSRSAFRDVAKAMGLPSPLIDLVASKLSYRRAGNMREELELAGISAVEDIVELCEQLDGHPRHLSLHNGGMLITAEPLIDVVPLEYATSGVRVCQFNKDDVEVLGLIKFDILGLRTLSILDESVRLIKEARDITLPVDDLSLDDPAVYDVICSSKTIGVFQIESPGQWALLERAQPRTFGDLIIQIALFRPGPLQGGMVNPYIERRLGREKVAYPHPSLERCLGDTLGVVIFQEQVLQVAHDFAGLSYADADGLRRAMSHYRTEVEMNVCRQAFVESAVQQGRDRELAERLYELITYFSGYGFCRSHAAAFAKTVYQTAFLKVYYPAEFLAAILSNEPCCYYPAQTVIEEARRWGIRVLPVDINRSGVRYGVEYGMIRMGLAQVKGLGEEAAETIVQARSSGRFRSLSDFWRRAGLDRDAVENLIALGAFDSLGSDRRQLLWQLEEVVQAASREGERPLPLHGGDLQAPLPELPVLTELDVAGLDFSLQGVSARYSIMTFYRRSLLHCGVLSIGQLGGYEPGSLVRTAGVVVSRQQPPTAKGMTFLVLTDEEGELPVAIYPAVYQEYRNVINGSSALIVEGTIERERYLTSLLATRVWRLSDAVSVDTQPMLPAHREGWLVDALP
ncbi:MAG TPA: DNA polymerase III subunit alpha [Chloroflexota bacterium]